MRALGILLANCLLLTIGASVPASAGGAGETCHGQPATLVGSVGREITGTPEADVVVTNGATSVYTGAGDDIVCVTKGAGLDDVDVLVEGGDDLVDTTANEAAGARTTLGDGDDTFVGGPGSDLVSASDPFELPRGQGADVVSTGGGPDTVATGGSPTVLDHDAINLGPGRDEAWVQGSVDPVLPIRGGDGMDELSFDRNTLRHSLRVNNVTEEATDAGAEFLTWDSMEKFSFSPIGSWEPPAFVGSGEDERVVSAVPLTSLDLGDGDDSVRLELNGRLIDDATYVGGGGRDSFVLNAGAGDQARRVLLDVPAGQLLFRPELIGVTAAIRTFEGYQFSAWKLNIIGSGVDEHIGWSGCRGTVSGAGGADFIEELTLDDVPCGTAGDDAKLIVRGGAGDDTMLGNHFPDTLLGGAGKDTANGRRNQDRCVAEVTTNCELLQ